MKLMLLGFALVMVAASSNSIALGLENKRIDSPTKTGSEKPHEVGKGDGGTSRKIPIQDKLFHFNPCKINPKLEQCEKKEHTE